MPMSDWFGSFLRDAVQDVGDEAVKEAATQLAGFLTTLMSPETVERLAHNKWQLKSLRLLRLVVPNSGPAWHAANEFVSDFFKRFEESFQEKVGHAHRTVNNPRAFEDEVAVNAATLVGDIATLRNINDALSEVPIDVREQFEGWFGSSPERRRKFVVLVTGFSKDEIKNYISNHPSELDRYTEFIPDRAERLNFMTLRLAAENDPELKKLLEDDMALINEKGPNQTIEFWFAVERAVQRGRINSINEFKDLMKLPPEEAFKRLGFKLRDKHHWDRYKDWRKTSVENSKLVKWIENLEKKSEQFAKGPRGQRS